MGKIITTAIQLSSIKNSARAKIQVSKLRNLDMSGVDDFKKEGLIALTNMQLTLQTQTRQQTDPFLQAPFATLMDTNQ